MGVTVLLVKRGLAAMGVCLGGTYGWRVPLFRKRRHVDEPDSQIADKIPGLQ